MHSIIARLIESAFFKTADFMLVNFIIFCRIVLPIHLYDLLIHLIVPASPRKKRRKITFYYIEIVELSLIFPLFSSYFPFYFGNVSNINQRSKVDPAPITHITQEIFMKQKTLSMLSASTLFIAISSHAFSSQQMPIHLVNETGLDDARIYFVIKGMDLVTKKDCLIGVDAATGLASCDEVSFGDDMTAYNYSLADIHTILLPKIEAGRMYFSIDYPMELYIDEENKILSPDGFKLRDVNYYKIYDKIEFTFDNTGSWTNPTAVDFFSFPIRIEQDNQNGTELKASGFYEPRQDIFEKLNEAVSEFDHTDNQEWQKLFISLDDKDKPGEDPTLLRFMSPGKAMLENVNPVHHFDDDYLKDEATYGIDYIDTLWEYYETNTLRINASELEYNDDAPDLENYEFSGRVEDGEFVFTNNAGENSYIVRIGKPTSSRPFFAGDDDEFSHVNNTPKAIIVRQLTSAFEVGLLPAPDNTVIDKAYFLSKKEAGLYYQDNPLLNAPDNTGPWHDVYAKALHNFDGEQYIYAFAYDDALGMDGTLHDPEASTLTVTLGDLSGLTIPNPYDDDTLYDVQVLLGENATVVYTDSDGNAQSLEHLDILSAVPSPLNLTANDNTADVYLKYPIVTPYYEGADGIVINPQPDGTIEMIFPAPPQA